MSVMQFETTRGRVKLEWPDDLTKEERVEILEDMVKLEKAEKTPFDFGDLRWKNA
jgi:hypothetical protein